MLTENTLKNILNELLAGNEFGCVYDFKERFKVSLTVIEKMGFVINIKTKIPNCENFCMKHDGCQWKSIFEQKKSKSVYKLTEKGIILAKKLANEKLPAEKLKEIVYEEIIKITIIDQLIAFISKSKTISTEQLISFLLKNSKYGLHDIRTNVMDILDLLVYINCLIINQGIIKLNS